ncbi:MAG: nickel-dependent lactate racemase [Pseudomonadales bacterium]|nr:nickel-dependent lactate racemase [Pseudomonadales bacterium]
MTEVDSNRFVLAYGQGELAVSLPDHINITTIEKLAFQRVDASEGDMVRHALQSPVNAETLRQAAQGARSACIVICDITRPVPNHLFLKPMVDELLAAGMSLNGITILVATGLHRPNEGEELRELIGDDWIVKNIRIRNHDARNDDDHVFLGETPSRHTPVGIDRLLVDADVRIVTGLVEPHFMAGYSGGRKVVAPGVAHHKTIRTFHAARFMEHPSATSCVLEGNPLHEEQLEILKMLNRAQAPNRKVLAFNTVIDEQRRLVFANFGEAVESHLAAVEVMRTSAEVRVGRKFHTVVTSSAGYPLDKTYYQTVKGMVTPLDILEPGGTLIVASECSEGMGSEDYQAAQQRLIDDREGFLPSLLAKDLADIDEWQTEQQVKSQTHANVQLFSNGLTDEDHLLTGVEKVDDVAKAILASIEASGDPSIAVIPEGPYVVPFADSM